MSSADDIADVDAVVIGAGVVGLACAYALANAGRDVLVLETARHIGGGISSRNSEVIHAGIYYPTNSLRHRLCIHGRRRLYPYLASRNVAHNKCGKLIVATSEREEAEIAGIYRRAVENRVEGVKLISGAQARALEPNLNARAALVSPETGIVDSHGLMRALLGDIERAGGAIAYEAPVLGGEVLSDGRILLEIGGPSPMRIAAQSVVNAAGLDATRVARAIAGVPAQSIPQLTLAKGSYFGASGAPAFQRLIYPAPVDGGLGVHLTLDLAGRMRFGPDVEWLDARDPGEVDYAVDPARAESFYEAIRRYWPALKDGALTPDYAGCRPKLSGKGEGAADFRIDGAEAHGVKNLVNLFGIESPGLTSSLAIGEQALARLEGNAPHAALKPTLFLDRDGTLNVEIGYAHKPEDFAWVPGAIDAVKMANARGWLAIVVTNQAGIGRGLYDEAAMQAFNAHMNEELARENAHIDALYFAPHHAEASDARYRHPDHPDRKPNPGMLLRAMREHPIDPLRALMVGDSDKDLEAAANAGLPALQYKQGDLHAQIDNAVAGLRW